MDLAVRRRVVLGVGSDAYNQVVTVVVQLAGVPLLLHAWGHQVYGEWLILFAVPSYLSMSDLGFTQSGANRMTALAAARDHAAALRIFRALGVLVIVALVGGLMLTAALVRLMPLGDWFSLRVLGGDAARLVVTLLAAEVFVRLLDGWLHAGFRASGDYALHKGMSSSVRLVQHVALWGVALTGGGPVGAALAFLAVRASSIPLIGLLLFRRHPWLRGTRGRVQMRQLRPLLRPAIANTAMPAAQALQIQGSTLVVGAALGPAAVVVFSTLRTLTRLVVQLVTVLNNAAEPEMAAAYGKGDEGLLRSLFVSTLHFALWAGLIAAAGLAVLGQPVVHIWTHGRVAFDAALFGWLLASAVASLLWAPGLAVLRAANRHVRAAAMFVLAAAVSLGASAWLGQLTHSVAAIGAALLTTDAAMLLTTLPAASALSNVKLSSLLKEVSRPRLAGLARTSLLGRQPGREPGS